MVRLSRRAAPTSPNWVVGWNGCWSDNLGTNNLDVRLKSNPGGIMSGNSSAAWNSFTNGRVTDVHTNFVTLEYGRVTPLPMSLSLKSEVSVLASSKPLPDTERIGLGGIQAVRGYVTEDGAVDQAVILRNSLYAPTPKLPAWIPGALAPFLLADVGWGRDLFPGATPRCHPSGLDSTLRPGLTSAPNCWPPGH